MTSFIGHTNSNSTTAKKQSIQNRDSRVTRDALKRAHPLFSIWGISGVYSYTQKNKLTRAIKDMIRRDLVVWVFFGILIVLSICILTLGLLPRPEGLTNKDSKYIPMHNYGSR